MSYSHDHHKDNCGPDPYNYGDISMCAEPDYMANDCDDQLPPFSVIGRGPRGEGVIAEITKQDDSTFMFKIESDETGETVIQSPNLHAGKIAIYQPNQNPQAGEAAQVSVSVVRDGKTSTYFLKLPPGAPGAFMFTARGVVDKKANNTYVYPIGDIAYDGNFGSAAQPTPRVNDMVIFITEDPERMYMSIGHIEAVESGNVVVTTRNYLSFGVPEIGSNGNWFVSGVDTGQPSVIIPVVTSTNTIAASGQASVVGKRINDLFAMDFNIPRGTTFTPSVSGSGNISFTNDGGRPNPNPVNIRGPKGEGGAQGPQGPKGDPGIQGPAGPTIQIMDGEYRQPGSSKDLPDLPAFADTSEGTAYVVDDDAIDGQYDLYIHGTNGTDWTIIDNWAGVPGPQGESGSRVFQANLDVPVVTGLPNNIEIYNANININVPNGGFVDGDMLILFDSSTDWKDFFDSRNEFDLNGRPRGYISNNILQFSDGTEIPVDSLSFARAYIGGQENRIVLIYNQSENIFKFISQTPGILPHALHDHSFAVPMDILAPIDYGPFENEIYTPISISAWVNTAVGPWPEYVRPIGHAFDFINTPNTESAVDSINSKINDYMFNSVLGEEIIAASNPVSVEALYGSVGFALGAGMSMSTPTDFHNIHTSGVYYVDDTDMMTDNPVPDSPVPGKFISDKDHFGIHHTYIAEDSRIFTRHASVSGSSWTPWASLSDSSNTTHRLLANKTPYTGDLNDLSLGGTAYLVAPSAVNRPPAGSLGGILEVISSNTDLWCFQRMQLRTITNYQNKIYTRTRNSAGVWSPWVLIASDRERIDVPTFVPKSPFSDLGTSQMFYKNGYFNLIVELTSGSNLLTGSQEIYRTPTSLYKLIGVSTSAVDAQNIIRLYDTGTQIVVTNYHTGTAAANTNFKFSMVIPCEM